MIKKSLLTVILLLALMLVMGQFCSSPQDDEDNENKNRDSQEQEVVNTQRLPQPAPPAPEEPPTPTNPEIEILNPNGGETISENTFEVEWRATDEDGDIVLVILEYQNQDRNSPWIRFTDYMDNDGTHLWDLANLEPGTYKVRATATDTKQQATDVSSIFTVE